MNLIYSDYLINENTTALLPTKNIEYNCLVREVDKQFYVKKTPMELIKHACLTYGSTYDGRRQAVMHQTDFKRKVPIPISIHQNIYAFPTHSTSDYECIWLFNNHIQSIHSIPSNSHPETRIVFNNHQSLSLPLSTYSIEKQIERAKICESIFSKNNLLTS